MSEEVLSSKIPSAPAIKRSLRVAFIVFLAGRILYTVWAIVVTQLVPAPLDPDPVLRPYYGQPAIVDGIGGYLLGPWQRFDTLNYLWLADDGYEISTSVFPPLYPLLIRAVSGLMDPLIPVSPVATAMFTALLVSNGALIGAFAMLHYLTTQALGEEAAGRTIAYLAFFPTGFFLFAGYSESLFLLFAAGSFYLAQQRRSFGAGLLGMLASLTRLTGWVLCLPLAYSYIRERSLDWRKWDWRAVGVILPILGLLLFLLWRVISGLPPIAEVYEQFWYQKTGIPGADLWHGGRSLLTGVGPRAGEISLALDLLTTMVLIITTLLIFRRLGVGYGLLNASLLFFMLLPTSQLKPLYSFSRYALVFFPTFMLLGQAGRNPWVHRLLLYSSLILALFFSGQFFLWGWVG